MGNTTMQKVLFVTVTGILTMTFVHDSGHFWIPFIKPLRPTQNLQQTSRAQNGLTDYWENVKELLGDCNTAAQDGSNVELTSVGLPTPCPPSSGVYYNLDQTGKMICNRICSIICYTFPDITYCPLLCPLVALFLHYVEEEKAHNCVCNLITAKNKVFLTQTKVQWDVCSLTALSLTRKYSKSSYAALVKNLPANEKLETIFGDWVWWVFRDLPTRIATWYASLTAMEGIKVLCRVTIGILTNFTKSKQSTDSNLAAAISEYCKGLELPPSRLLKSSFSIRNFRSNEIRRVTAKVHLGIKGSGGEQNKGHSPYSGRKTGDAMPTSRS